MTDTASATDAAPASGPTPYGELLAGLRQTFDAGRTRPVAWRKEQLRAIVAMLTERSAEFEAALIEDLGRPALEAYGQDVGYTLLSARHALANVDRWVRTRRVSPGLRSLPGRAEIIPEPYGVALVIAPWNYPVQLLVAPMVAAVAAGNCVVAKPSELAPASAAVLSRLVPHYLDDDAVAVVEGAVPETTELLRERFDHIFFTGSTNVGKVVMRAAAEHLTPVTLELGGKSPSIVAADADLEVAARRLAWAKFMNAGQTCIAPDYVLAERPVRDELVDRIVAQVRTFFGDDPARSPDLGRIVNERHHGRLMGLLGGSGGRIVVGGEADLGNRYLAPTVVVDPDLDSGLMQEEIFGPILPVLAVDSVEDAIAFVNERPKPLALYVYTGQDSIADRVLARTSSGGACINHSVVHIIPDELPFGGVGPSGMGTYHGKAGFDAFTHHKSVLRKPTSPDPALLYPPYTALKEKVLRLAMR